MRKFSYFLKFLVVVSYSQYMGLLSAGSDEGGRDGDVLLYRPGPGTELGQRPKSNPILLCPSTRVSRENPEGQISLEPLELPTSSSTAISRVPPMSPTSFSRVVEENLGSIKTTRDYAKYISQVRHGREAFSKTMGIRYVIEESESLIERLELSIEQSCHDVLHENGFIWGETVGPGYFRIAKNVMELLGSQKNLGLYFRKELDTKKFHGDLEAILLKCQATLKEISEEKASLKELRDLACIKRKTDPFTYTWNNSDF